MQPATVKNWHTKAFRIFWRWKSRNRLDRPTICKHMQDLIHKLSNENPLWSAEKIRDTLLLLGYASPCDDTHLKDSSHSTYFRPLTPNCNASNRLDRLFRGDTGGPAS